jgi:hypothetical protein
MGERSRLAAGRSGPTGGSTERRGEEIMEQIATGTGGPARIGKKSAPARNESARRREEYDPPWKEVLVLEFAAFMAFFLPEAYAEIDWSRPYQVLDKELRKISRDANLGPRLADMLIKVWLKDCSTIMRSGPSWRPIPTRGPRW